jgi:hypothetical protein
MNKIINLESKMPMMMDPNTIKDSKMQVHALYLNLNGGQPALCLAF